MAGIKNKYDFYKGFLEALGAQGINETDYKNEEELRKKILDTLNVEYVFDDVNQTDLFREKFLQGISSGGGGGGSSDFSTAEVTVQITSAQPGVSIFIPTVISSPMEAIANNPYHPISSSTPQTVTVPLYKGSLIINGIWNSGDVTVDTSGSVQVMESSFLITGDCTITIS